jgi:APA family basic amino acid/polyamine antiporter
MFQGYRAKAMQMVAYARDKKMFDLPVDYRLDILETPAVLRDSVDASYYPAPPFKKSGVGRFYLTPTDGILGRLQENNFHAMADLCAHEGFPGHDWYYQFLRLHNAAISPIRWLTPGAVVRESGSGGLALIVWVVGGVLSLLGALTFAELGASNPDSGGMYAYLKDAFGSLLAFLYGWTMFLVIGSGSLATLGAAFPRYVSVFVPLSPAGARAVSVLMIALVTVLNVRGTRQSANVQGVATTLKAGVILTLVVLLVAMGPRGAHAGDVWWPDHLSFSVVSGAVTGMIGVLWAYEGWQYVTFSAGETIDPQRVFARGIVVGTLILIAVYVLANVGYFSALGVAGVAGSSRVASDAATAVLGPWAGKLLAAVILVSIFSASNGMMLTLPRLFYAMARDGVFFAGIAKVHPRFGTPAASIVGTAAWSTVLVLTGSFEQLLTYVVFMSWLWFAAAALAIFAYRRASPTAHRPFRTPGYPLTPVLFVLSALVIVVNTVVAQPVQSLVGLGIAFVGLPAYFIWRRRA